MEHSVRTTWKKEMVFESDVNGHKLLMDAPEASGGQDKGPRPKPLMLAALAGCTGIDVVGILKKMRIDPDHLEIIVEGDTAEDFPKHYTHLKVIFEFHGKDLPKDKLQKAVELSRDKYCGVSHIYKQVIDIEYEIRVIED